jgi:predicted O-methyltransferase YrrM
MTTLAQPRVSGLLERLYARAETNDAEVRARNAPAVARLEGPWDDQVLAPLLEDSFMCIAPEVGRLLYLLVRSRRPELVVEFGTSFGISAIHLAAALRDNGAGRLITTEQSSAKAERAAAHIREAGLEDWVEIRRGDAFTTLAGVDGIDLLFLDGWKKLYLPLLQQLEPHLKPGCLVAADDVTSMAAQLAPYLEYVRQPANGYVSCEVTMDDGLELSCR